MCDPTESRIVNGPADEKSPKEVAQPGSVSREAPSSDRKQLPIDSMEPPPSLTARCTCTTILVAIFAIWGKLTFVDEAAVPGGTAELHSWKIPAAMTTFYLVSLPLLRMFSSHFLSKKVDVKLLLRESMILYNAGQVLLNGWMVYRFIDALLFRGHPFIGGASDLVETGATYAVWVHYCDKYLEFLDTYFMVLRGKMDQVSFLHVYHHTSISWAWWFGLKLYPGGDVYFGALLNSWIHVMMYSYYTLSLLKIRCPWKKYLTQAQLLQFTAVLGYSVWSMSRMDEEGPWLQYVAHSIQDFEMISLFVLFMHFYRKAYIKKKKGTALKLAEEKLSSGAPESDSGSDGVAEQASVSSASSDEDRDERSR